jgi:hypothetical protein
LYFSFRWIGIFNPFSADIYLLSTDFNVYWDVPPPMPAPTPFPSATPSHTPSATPSFKPSSYPVLPPTLLPIPLPTLVPIPAPTTVTATATPTTAPSSAPPVVNLTSTQRHLLDTSFIEQQTSSSSPFSSSSSSSSWRKVELSEEEKRKREVLIGEETLEGAGVYVAYAINEGAFVDCLPRQYTLSGHNLDDALGVTVPVSPAAVQMLNVMKADG